VTSSPAVNGARPKVSLAAGRSPATEIDYVPQAGRAELSRATGLLAGNSRASPGDGGASCTAGTHFCGGSGTTVLGSQAGGSHPRSRDVPRPCHRGTHLRPCHRPTVSRWDSHRRSHPARNRTKMICVARHGTPVPSTNRPPMDFKILANTIVQSIERTPPGREHPSFLLEKDD